MNTTSSNNKKSEEPETANPDRGEQGFERMPDMGVKMYSYLVSGEFTRQRVSEIADELLRFAPSGKLLEIGFGTGDLLEELYEKNSEYTLYGIDISRRMTELANDKFRDHGMKLDIGNIDSYSFDDIFFDCTFCVGSFYLWTNPVKCLNNIFRTLKAGKSAVLYETYKDRDMKEYKKAFNENQRQQSLLRSAMSRFFLKRQHRMTYNINEMVDIIKQSDFKDSFSYEKITLGRLPMWLRITLTKNA